MTQPATANSPRSGSDRIIPHLAALVSDARLGALQPHCVELADLSQMSASEAAMKFGGGVMLRARRARFRACHLPCGVFA